MAMLLEYVFSESEPKCICGHHKGSHDRGFTLKLCRWCDCRGFEDPGDSLNKDTESAS